MENKQLSPIRVFLALLMLAGILYAALVGLQWLQGRRLADPVDPWFAPYVDVTATPTYAFEQTEAVKAHKNVVLSFIVSSKEDACTPTWGTAYTLEQANTVLDLDRRIARFRQLGGSVAVSFGGALNDELAVNCTNSGKLKAAYLAVIERYGIDTIDLDIEGAALSNLEANKRRAEALADLQKALRAEDRELAIWLTLPVAPQGLTAEGTTAISQMLAAGVDLAGVNVMTMDYGASRQELSMREASVRALTETRRQLGILYEQAGIRLGDAALWAKLGATPMIGQNDVSLEIFTLEDAKGFGEFATSKGIARMSMWSSNRDIECGENYVNLTVVSDSCSGVLQEPFAFAITLGQGFDGSIPANAALITTSEPVAEQKADNPDESPYQIWSESTSYLQGTKVVWHSNVYEAKWWTRGDVPDNPVLQAYETPWQLIGPVLPGERPIPQPTLPPGTYPVWIGTEVYEAGQRILFNGVPYEAKWWTQGDSPAAATSDPDGSPWIVLSQKEVQKIISSLK